MELKEKLVSSFMAFEDTVDVDSPVHDIRTEAIKHFENEGFAQIMSRSPGRWWRPSEVLATKKRGIILNTSNTLRT